jgi:hypothetical protein
VERREERDNSLFSLPLQWKQGEGYYFTEMTNPIIEKEFNSGYFSNGSPRKECLE